MRQYINILEKVLNESHGPMISALLNMIPSVEEYIEILKNDSFLRASNIDEFGNIYVKREYNNNYNDLFRHYFVYSKTSEYDRSDYNSAIKYLTQKLEWIRNSIVKNAQEENGKLVLWRILKAEYSMSIFSKDTDPTAMPKLRDRVKSNNGQHGIHWTWMPNGEGDYARYGSHSNRIILRGLLNSLDDIDAKQTRSCWLDRSNISRECEITLKPNIALSNITQTEK